MACAIGGPGTPKQWGQLQQGNQLRRSWFVVVKIRIPWPALALASDHERLSRCILLCSGRTLTFPSVFGAS